MGSEVFKCMRVKVGLERRNAMILGTLPYGIRVLILMIVLRILVRMTLLIMITKVPLGITNSREHIGL